MPTIKFTATAAVFDFNQIDPETKKSGRFVDDKSALKSLDGLSYSDELFSDYIGDGKETLALVTVGITGGSLSFAFDSKSKRLLGSTEYSLARLLSPEEINILKLYTIRQWSDGIGSNFFQERIDEGLAPQVLIADERIVHVEQRS
jgi:hypothetical protein